MINLDKKLDIVPDTTIADLLNSYPRLEDKLIEIAPIFKKLKNPILRRTIAKVTSLRQAAVIGKVPLPTLINTLRNEIGQDSETIEEKTDTEKKKPEWVITSNIKVRYDAIEDIENGVHPITRVLKELNDMNENEIYLLTAPFLPLPLIEILEGKGFKTYSNKIDENKFEVYIIK